MTINKAPAWAWQFNRGALGRWAEPTKRSLEINEMPSPEAKMVPVYLITRKQWRILNEAISKKAIKTNRKIASKERKKPLVVNEKRMILHFKAIARCIETFNKEEKRRMVGALSALYL